MSSLFRRRKASQSINGMEDIRSKCGEQADGKSLSVVLPCFNEAKSIPGILQRFAEVIDRNDVEIILVDNGSTDNTQEVLEELLPKYTFARSVRVGINKGYGFGINSGLKVGKGRFLGWTHADMQTDPVDVLRGFSIIEKSNEPSRTCVKGWRYGRAMSDNLFTIGMALFASVILWAPLFEINAQPNIYPREFFEKYNEPPVDFSFDLYYYFQARKDRLTMKRICVAFGKRIHGQSHWNINWQSKLKFIRRTVEFTFKLRSRLSRLHKSGSEDKRFPPSYWN